HPHVGPRVADPLTTEGTSVQLDLDPALARGRTDGLSPKRQLPPIPRVVPGEELVRLHPRLVRAELVQVIAPEGFDVASPRNLVELRPLPLLGPVKELVVDDEVAEGVDPLEEVADGGSGK